MQKVLVLYGGRSTEHEVSARSAAFLLKYLDRTKYQVFAMGIDKEGVWHPLPEEAYAEGVPDSLPIIPSTLKQRSTMMTLLGLNLSEGVQQTHNKTVVFSIIHGNSGEDGKLQGFLEMLEVPFVGPDTLGSAVAMDKVVAKILVKSAGIDVVDYLTLRAEHWRQNEQNWQEKILTQLGLPLFVKPARGGSSVGVKKVKNAEELKGAIENGFAFDDKLLIEVGLDVREIECAALGGYEPLMSSAGEVIPQAEFYTYDAKYIDAHGALVEVPAKLTQEEVAEVREIAKKCFMALNLYGLARIDLFLEKNTRKFYFNEANTIPGFTPISQYPMLWQYDGYSPQKLLTSLVDSALERHGRRKLLKTFI